MIVTGVWMVLLVWLGPVAAHYEAKCLARGDGYTWTVLGGCKAPEVSP